MTTQTKPKPAARRKKKAEPAVLVTMVLDRSGSMGGYRDETIEAFNTYVEQLRGDEGETFVTLRLFDNKHDLVYRALPVSDVPLLSHETYVPRSSTALNDAIALAVSDADTADVQEGTKHLLVVLTDGYENASTEHSKNSIKRLLEERQNLHGWTVVFLQGNLDLPSAQHHSAAYGVFAGNTATSGPKSARATMGALASVTSTVRNSSGSSQSAFGDAGMPLDYSQGE